MAAAGLSHVSGSGLKLQLGTFVHFSELQSSLAVALLNTHAPSYAQKENGILQSRPSETTRAC